MTTKEEILRLALRFPDSYSDMPFDDNWTVVRHRDNKKIFAWIFERQGRVWVNLKAPPDWRDLWRGGGGFGGSPRPPHKEGLEFLPF